MNPRTLSSGKNVTANEQTMSVLSEGIKKWAKTKKAFISLSSYVQEIEQWRLLTGVNRVERILEIGSGSGWFLTTAVALGFAESGVGIDPAISEEGTHINEILSARSAIERLNLSKRVCFHICTLEDLLQKTLVKSPKYDLLVSRNALHHIFPRSKNNLTEYEPLKKCIETLHLARCFLKDSGYLYIIEATRPSKFYAAAYNSYRLIRGAPTINWSSKRTPLEWKLILQKAGFGWIGATKLSAHHSLITRIIIGKLPAKLLSHQFLFAARMKNS